MRCLLLLCVLLTSGLRLSAQVVKLNTPHTVHPQLTIGSISLTASPSSVNLTLVPQGQTAPSNITITGALSITALGSFSLYGYFTSTTALTSAAGDSIPTSAVLAKCPNGIPTSYTPFTQTGPFGGGGSSLLIYQTASLAALMLHATQACSLIVDLSSIPQLPAGSYTGTLTFQAQAL